MAQASEVRGKTVFIAGEPGSPVAGWIAGGLTLLDRQVRAAARAGAARIVVACDGDVPQVAVPVERVAAGSPAPADAVVRRVDELADVRIDSPESLRRAEWTHMQGMQKSYQGLTDAYVNHHVSLRITRVLARLPIHPNHISLATIFLGLACAAGVAWGGPLGLALGAIGLQLHNILDSCDGELARLRYQFSRSGAWIDSISDDITDTTFVAALGVAAGGVWLPIALGVAATRIYLQTDTYRHVLTRLGGDPGAFRWWFESDKSDIDDVYDRRSWTTYVRALARRDTYALLWAILTLCGLLPVVIVYAGVIFGVQAGLMVAHSVITWRRGGRTAA